MSAVNVQRDFGKAKKAIPQVLVLLCVGNGHITVSCMMIKQIVTVYIVVNERLASA